MLYVSPELKEFSKVELMDHGRDAMVIVLFGLPGSGKSTQANLLRQSLGLPGVSAGDLLRAHMAAGDSVGRTVADLMRSGHLVPDETVSRIVTDRIQEPDCAQ